MGTGRSDVDVVHVPPASGRSSTVLRWIAVVLSLYLLISAVSVISRGFRSLGAQQAEQLFAFAENPLVGLAVGILATVLIQSSTTTTAITVAAVGSGALDVTQAIPIILGANVGTTVTCTFVALGFAGNATEFRRALASSTIHDFYNLLALLIFFPLEVLFHPLERMSGVLTDSLYGVTTPDPGDFNVVRMATRPLVNAVTSVTGLAGEGTTSAVLTIVVGVAMIFLAVRWLSHFLKALMVGRTRELLLRAVEGTPAKAIGVGAGVTIITQSSTVTNSVLVPFAGTGTVTPGQLYPVTVGANLGTTLTALVAALAVNGPDAAVGLQAALVHVLYNLLALLVVFVNPVLRPLPLKLASGLADLVAERRWLLAVYLVAVFVVVPSAIILLGALGKLT